MESRHLMLSPGDVGEYVFLPGDPSRCGVVATYFEDARRVGRNRAFTTYTGSVAGHRVSVTSTGIGCPSAAIAMEELVALGAHTLIRVGTAGGMQPEVRLGELVVTQAAVRHEGTSVQYMPLAFPAVADTEVTLALRDAARRLGVPYHVGISHSKDSFYGEVAPDRTPIATRLRAEWMAWVKGGVLCSEMEASTLFTVARVLGVRAGGIMLVAGLTRALNPGEVGRLTESEREEATDRLAQVAVEAVRLLIRRDGFRTRARGNELHCDGEEG